MPRANVLGNKISNLAARISYIIVHAADSKFGGFILFSHRPTYARKQGSLENFGCALIRIMIRAIESRAEVVERPGMNPTGLI